MSETINNIDNDIIYIFKPLINNKLPKSICQYSELAWIINTKSSPLPHLSLNNNYNIQTISFHIHSSNIRRVYFSVANQYMTRVMKHNLINVIKPFCINNNTFAFASSSNYLLRSWYNEINTLEFKDTLFDKFYNLYFSDIKLDHTI